MKPEPVAQTAFISTETFTQRAFKRWAENRPMTDINRYELTNGRIVMTPPAGWEHAEIEARVIHVLKEFVERNNLGRVFGSSAGYNLPSGDTLEPDASFISHERWARGPQVRRGEFLKIVPSLVVEILSPATARRDRIEKKRSYEANGVEEYWIVDPESREVTIFQLVGEKYGVGKRAGFRQKLCSYVLKGLEVPTRSLFA